MRAVVTVRIARNAAHDPQHKKTGRCPLFRMPFTPFEVQGTYTCTDVTGEHHSYIAYGENIADIRRKAEAKYKHVTRIEVC